MNVQPVAGAIVSNTNDDDLIHRITTRGISIAQFIIGSLSLILGIVIVILGIRPSIGLGILDRVQMEGRVTSGRTLLDLLF